MSSGHARPPRTFWGPSVFLRSRSSQPGVDRNHRPSDDCQEPGSSLWIPRGRTPIPVQAQGWGVCRVASFPFICNRRGCSGGKRTPQFVAMMHCSDPWCPHPAPRLSGLGPWSLEGAVLWAGLLAGGRGHHTEDRAWCGSQFHLAQQSS